MKFDHLEVIHLRYEYSERIGFECAGGICAARPNGLTVEIDQTGNLFIEQLLVEPLTVRDGQLQLSQLLGLVVELNRQTIECSRLNDPYSIPEGFYSDMVFGKTAVRPSGADRENS